MALDKRNYTVKLPVSTIEDIKHYTEVYGYESRAAFVNASINLMIKNIHNDFSNEDLITTRLNQLIASDKLTREKLNLILDAVNKAFAVLMDADT